MRLSPKCLFLGLVIVGLPFAVVAGWALGAPASRTAATGALAEPGGTGGLGAAPVTGVPVRDRASSRHRHSPARAADRPTAPPATSTAVNTPAATVTVTVVTSVPPPLVTSAPPPPLTDPPVPTPTHIVEPPSPSPTTETPSATPSRSVTAVPSGAAADPAAGRWHAEWHAGGAGPFAGD